MTPSTGSDPRRGNGRGGAREWAALAAQPAPKLRARGLVVGSLTQHASRRGRAGQRRGAGASAALVNPVSTTPIAAVVLSLVGAAS